MDYSFINDYKEKYKNGFSSEEKKAYESIIQILFRMKLYGKEKARQIDEYDGESLFSNRTLYPGHIYAFIYKAQKPCIYDDGQIKFAYSDTLPIVLVTHAEPTYIRGINLNLCSYPMRAYILNTLHNLDLKFYERGNLDMANNKKAPISDNVMKTFLTPEKEKAFFDFIKNSCKLQHTEILYRTYNIKNIKEIRLIEVWQHKYIPFLTYNGELKADVLKMIHYVTGTDNIII